MNLEMFVTWIVVGLLTGWLLGLVLKHGGYGRISDAILGLAGSGAASTLASAFGAPSEAGRGAMAVVAFVGAAVASCRARPPSVRVEEAFRHFRLI